MHAKARYKKPPSGGVRPIRLVGHHLLTTSFESHALMSSPSLFHEIHAGGKYEPILDPFLGIWPTLVQGSLVPPTPQILKARGSVAG